MYHVKNKEKYSRLRPSEVDYIKKNKNKKYYLFQQLLLQETVQQPSYFGRSVVVECIETSLRPESGSGTGTGTSSRSETGSKPVRVPSTKCRSKKKPLYFDENDPRSPAHIPILAPSAGSTTTTTTTTSRHVSTTRHVTTGCCVAMGVNKLTRNRRPLSGSYSALVRT